MIEATLNHADTTFISDNSDVLGDVLSSMRINGSIILNEEYLPPWGIAIPNTDQLRQLLQFEKGIRIVAFHYVKRGFIEVTANGEEPIIIEAGEMAICFGGVDHHISQGAYTQAIPVESLLNGDKNPFNPSAKDKVRSTSLMCGVFIMRNTTLNPLLESLPAILHATALHPSSAHNLSGVLKWMDQETTQKTQGSNFVIERLLELVCAEALRSYLDAASHQVKWFTGIKDPVVGRAISLIHSQPSESWSVKRLAEGVSMSPSRFAARFTGALGDSPIAYVAKWRMNIAGRLLDESQKGIEEIATEVGYENVAAFTRAFKRHLGMPPTAWRSR